MINDWYQQIVFAYPYLLWLLVLLPLLIVWYLVKNKKATSSVTISTLRIYKRHGGSKTVIRHLPFVLRLLAMALLIISIARPQTRNNEERIEGEGIDIVLCMDVSGSMLAEDFAPNRMEAMKKVAADFVDARKTDRIGLVIFSGEPFTQCPITSDYAALKSQIYAVRSGILQDGTAIGSGLATSVERLKKSKSKSKVIILLTDGENNGGLIPPSTAKEIAKAYNIKVYTIGMGTEGFATLPQQTTAGVVRTKEKVNIDEKLLQEIARETGGNYFRATDNESLSNIYVEIDKLEKSRIETSSFARYAEQFYPLAIAAVLLLLIESWLRYKVLRKFP
ncbi:MAG: VWA domain-containing protein [Chitinophagaceae bacterium]|jgi:Ca-activated chloride channel homolog|nr:VWA domain-containing protein [Chitinophagaceae bacterium]